MDLSYEHRFGNEAVIELSGYYRWISDLQDLIPLTDTEEAPGNIGNGSRWGIFLEGSVPLDLLGMTNAKLNFFFRRRGTEAVDPVTGRKREFSINNPRNLKYSHNLNFRQDFVSTRMAWGVNANYQSDRPFFKVNELDVHDNGINLNTFIESSRWFGIKMRLNLNNVLNSTDTRNRTIFTGRRDLSPLEALRFEKSKNGREIQLTLSGSF